jgi:deoxyribodipyrimidine photo-lyase
MIQKERVKALNSRDLRKGKFVLYWMQAAQRTEYNHALEYAISRANELHEPLIVFFGITDQFPEANERHYYFMLEGLREVRRFLKERGILMAVQHVSPELGAVQIARDASLAVTDRGYLRIQKAWRNYAAASMECPLFEVETDVIVPVEETSPKEEYAAATIRPKIHKKLPRFLVPLRQTDPFLKSTGFEFPSFDIDDPGKANSRLRIDRSVKRVSSFHGGTTEARKKLDLFLETTIDDFPEGRNDPTRDNLSNISPYLHFGQLSPLYVALRVAATESHGQEAYLEELIVRRELSMNFVHYNSRYDSFEGLPEWARKTLKKHQKDRRRPLYTEEELETAVTHDPYWNAAQKEMTLKGKMHGYMRMYWGKKILEWTETPEEALRVALYLNNKYELDGRDPNGFAGVAWCLGKHDRPWKEREIFGTVRYMNANGLKRKFDADAYVKMIEALKEEHPE